MNNRYLIAQFPLNSIEFSLIVESLVFQFNQLFQSKLSKYYKPLSLSFHPLFPDVVSAGIIVQLEIFFEWRPRVNKMAFIRKLNCEAFFSCQTYAKMLSSFVLLEANNPKLIGLQSWFRITDTSNAKLTHQELSAIYVGLGFDILSRSQIRLMFEEALYYYNVDSIFNVLMKYLTHVDGIENISLTTTGVDRLLEILLSYNIKIIRINSDKAIRQHISRVALSGLHAFVTIRMVETVQLANYSITHAQYNIKYSMVLRVSPTRRTILDLLDTSSSNGSS